MLRVDKNNKSLVRLEPKTMKESGYWERRDIQEMICKSPGPFCDELGEYIHIVGSEVRPTDVVQDRIDVLGIDPDGNAVVIELKRDSHKLQLLQALSYVGMVAEWQPKQFIEQLVTYNKKWGASASQKIQTLEQARDEIEEILEEGDIESINRNQRIVLLAEDFEYEVLITAEWLSERYDVDIRCYHIGLAKNGNEDFLTCTRAYPPPELTDIAINRRRKRDVGTAATDWDGALKNIANEAVVKFFKQELAEGRSNNLKYKSIRFFIGKRRRFSTYAKIQKATVRQLGRFEGDMDFWSQRLGQSANIRFLKDGHDLAFALVDENALKAFKKAVTVELLHTEFQGAPEDDGDDAEDLP